MKTNSDMTLYKKSVTAGVEAWARSVIADVFWESVDAANVRITGNMKADKAYIYIPLARGDSSIQPGDVLVKGEVADTITGSFTISSLKAKYGARVVTVRSNDKKDYGSTHLQHWRIGAS